MIKIIRNANVETKLVYDTKADTMRVRVEINGRYRHTFDIKSKVHKLSQSVEFPILKNKLNGGTYAIDEETDNIIDFQYSDYKGYVRSDYEVDSLSDKLGFSRSKVGKSARGDLNSVFNQFRHRDGVFLGGVSNEAFYLDIEALQSGGAFKNRLVYRWSPFDRNIQTSIEVERLICANGMVGMAPLVTREAPIINDVERNLDVLESQLRPEMSRILESRFTSMANSRASVADVRDALDMIKARMRTSEMNEHDFMVLQGLANAVSMEHLRGVFTPDLIDSQAAKTAPSDLTQFDLFNVLTEMSSHTSGDAYSNKDTQMFINRLVFDTLKEEINGGNVKVSDESDHKRIFFGQ